MALVNTIGINMPDDFPTDAYNGVHDRLREYRNRNPDSATWLEYAAGWNAVASRFKTMADADEQFTQQIITQRARQVSLSHHEMQLQEEHLYRFFMNGHSTIESFCYAMFALGALLYPTKFPMSTYKQLQVISPALLQQKYASEFPCRRISVVLTALVSCDADYKNWRKIRNILAHRVVPRRTIHVHLHEGSRPDTMVNRPTEWGEIELDEETTQGRRLWLASTLIRCVEAAQTFATNHF
jgi:hypothetical protein